MQTYNWYVTNYPDGPRKVLGFLDYHVIYFLQFDHIYTSVYFLGVTTLLTASLVVCSKTQQFPLVKVARRWKFAKTQSAVVAKGNGATMTYHDKQGGRLRGHRPTGISPTISRHTWGRQRAGETLPGALSYNAGI